MKIPKYITHFYRRDCKPFQSICDLNETVAEDILKRDTGWRGDGTYLQKRIEHERKMRNQFMDLGGRPIRQHPIYAILGNQPDSPHTFNEEFKVIVPLNIFPSEVISFTYPDSLYRVPLDDLGRVYLERSETPNIFLKEQIEKIVALYKVYEYNNHSIEAQIWDDEPINNNRDKLIFLDNQ